MLVDNAVVVLESIYQKLEKGMDRVTAACIGTQEVLTAVVASTLTSIIIFVPLIFGEKTDFSVFFSNAGVSIIFALLASLFASLTLIPLAMALVLKIDVTKRSRWQQWMVNLLGPLFLRLGRRVAVWRRKEVGDGVAAEGKPRPSLIDRYVHMVMWPLQHRVLVGLLIVPAIIAGSIWVLKNKVPDNTPDAESLRSLSINYEFSENFHYVKIVEDYIRPVERFLVGNKERFKIIDVFSNYNNNWARTEVHFDVDNITIDEMSKIRDEIKAGLPIVPGAKIEPGMQGGAQNREWISLTPGIDRFVSFAAPDHSRLVPSGSVPPSPVGRKTLLWKSDESVGVNRRVAVT
jgi:HAE1 family hydrophobic/amphiphilic exporter-1